MEYLVEVSPAALGEAEAAYQWIAKSSPANAARWFNGLLDAVISLESNLRRCSLARENGLLPVEIRQLVYGSYRILFVVRENTVRVLRIRHSARRTLRQEDLTVRVREPRRRCD